MERLEIEANGFTFSARSEGTGNPVLLLHGFPQTSWMWRNLIPVLSENGYRAVAPDMRGYSPRARPEEIDLYSIPYLLSDVLALADTLEMQEFSLIGHDWGGLLGWVLAARYPERIKKLIVASTPHPSAMRKVAVPEGFDRFVEGHEAEQLLMGEDRRADFLRSIYVGLSDSDADEYVHQMSVPGTLDAALNWFRAGRAEDVTNLPPIVVPTRYVWSTLDPALPKAAAEESAQWVAGQYRFDVLEGFGHFIPEEAHGLFASMALEHLAQS